MKLFSNHQPVLIIAAAKTSRISLIMRRRGTNCTVNKHTLDRELYRCASFQVLLYLRRVFPIELFQFLIVPGVALVDVIHILCLVVKSTSAEILLLRFALDEVSHHSVNSFFGVLHIPWQYGVQPSVEQFLPHFFLATIVVFHVRFDLLRYLPVVSRAGFIKRCQNKPSFDYERNRELTAA